MAPRRSALGRTLALLAMLGAVLVALAMLRTARVSDEAGQLWRCGLVAGEQIRLFDNGRYQRQSWHLFGETTTESGAWSPLAEFVSLVPGTPGDPPRLLRKTRIDGSWYLYESSEGSGEPPSDSFYRRIE